jgi:hypothetical protein
MQKYAELRRRVIVETGRDPYTAWRSHQKNASTRGIDFALSFEEWWSLWEPKFIERGTSIDAACMCRTGDEGGYTVGNVRIDTVRGNLRERDEVQLKRDIKEAWDFDGEDRSGCADWLTSRRSGDYFDEME